MYKMSKMMEFRRVIVRQMITEGMTVSAIAKELGLTIHQVNYVKKGKQHVKS